MTAARAARVGAVVSVAALLATACAASGASVSPTPVPTSIASGPSLDVGSPDATGTTDVPALPTPTTGPTTGGAGAALYLVDVNTTDTIGARLAPGILDGVVGTIPGTVVPQSFRDTLSQADPGLTSFAFAAEAYDAVILAALAAADGSDAGRDMATRLVALTSGTTECSEYAECLAALQRGSTISYRGRSGLSRLSAAGEPDEATVGVYRFGADNRLTPQVDYRTVDLRPARPDADGPAKPQQGAGDRRLTIGTLLPATGTLAFMRRAQLDAVRLAVKDIRAAGGVPGTDEVRLLDADAGEDPGTTGAAGLKALASRGVDVIVGTGATTSAGGIVPRATADGILVLAPVNTALTAPARRYHGLYWRLSASAVRAQAAALRDLVVASGHRRVAVIHAQDEYAASLSQAVVAAVPRDDVRVVADVGYESTAKDFAGIVGKVRKARPDAIVLVGFDESAQVVGELVRQGIGPNAAG